MKTINLTNFKMRIKNVTKFIKDYESILNVIVDEYGFNELWNNVKYKCGESYIKEGDTFCVEDKKYIKNSFGSLEAQIISFNFKVILKKYKYIIDEDTGEQVFDEVIEEVVEYLGFN